MLRGKALSRLLSVSELASKPKNPMTKPPAQDDTLPPDFSGERVHPIERITKFVNNLRGRGLHAAADDQVNPDQLSLFPNQRLYPVPSQPDAPRGRAIRLPRSVLTILPNEQLHHYLSRVAAAAMTAATRSCGSAALASVRLGTGFA